MIGGVLLRAEKAKEFQRRGQRQSAPRPQGPPRENGSLLGGLPVPPDRCNRATWIVAPPVLLRSSSFRLANCPPLLRMSEPNSSRNVFTMLMFSTVTSTMRSWLSAFLRAQTALSDGSPAVPRWLVT